ncbi:MAG: uroporphyrinogen-III C-methyltransferase [Candidatus Hydrogenedentota bacterium]
MSSGAGKVYLVGAGPGDRGLMTLRGRECLEHADVVVYDTLANEVFLEWARQAEHIFVGKSADRHTLLQEEINRVLAEQARRVNRVVRLKGGDPFVFGRGGEEALYLAEQGIPFEVVPGVTAGAAVPAYAGIPVTHRGLAGSVTLITGHEDPAKEESGIDLGTLGLKGTLVFFMPVKNLPKLCAELIRLGRDPGTPAAVIEWGTYPRQRSVRGTLRGIAAQAEEANIQPPAVAVVGEVAALADRLSWFESRPLFGQRIAVTRSRQQASDLVGRLSELGADVFEFPTIQIKPPEEPGDFGWIGDYDWIVFTSVNGVEMLFERLDAQGCDARDLAGVRLCVIGAATAGAVRKRFLRIDAMPDKYVAEELLAVIHAHEPDLRGKRFLLPRADIARSFLPEELRKHGAEVTELVAYRTVPAEESAALADRLVAHQPTLITFASSSTVRNFCRLLGEERTKRIQQEAVAASIGPITSATARECGFHVAVEPAQHDIPHLVEAIVEWSQG